MSAGDPFALGRFSRRHLGPQPGEIAAMLGTLGAPTLDEVIAQTVPAAIRLGRELELPPAASEEDALSELSGIMDANEVWRSHIGMGYYGSHTPFVVRRNILENPGWYTAYTPYQAEIAQGRMEALLNFQTMVCDLTGMQISNASLLDESTAAAEAMAMAHGIKGGDLFVVSTGVHPQTLSLIETRAEPLGIRVVSADPATFDFAAQKPFGVLLQYPATDGGITDPAAIVASAQAAGALVVVATDLLALTLLKPPGEFGVDIAVGSSQRFGVPLGYGGPHAGFLATRDEHKRRMPGRIVGVSRDAEGSPALRLTLQTREQHIRREKATSNICTAQVLLAVIASMYAVYHGPEGLKAIASRVHGLAVDLALKLQSLGWKTGENPFFDTVRVDLGGTPAETILARARAKKINLRLLDDRTITISLDETTGSIADLLEIFGASPSPASAGWTTGLPAGLARESAFLTHPVFSRYHTETELLRYIRRLESRDLSLTTSMIPLGSCTMKLNASAEMLPVTWEKVGGLHPFAPVEQAQGYAEMFRQLEAWLSEITGFAATSLQPNAGSQGEYAGLLTIRAYHLSRGDTTATSVSSPPPRTARIPPARPWPA